MDEAAEDVRQGWFEDVDAKTFFALRYAGKSIEFAKGMEAPGSSHARLLRAGLHDRVPAPIGGMGW